MESTALIDWISFTLPKEYPSWDVKFLDSQNSVHRVINELFKLDTEQFSSSSARDKWYRSRYTVFSKNGHSLLSVSLSPVSANNSNTTAFSVPGYALSSAADALNIDPIELIKKIALLGGTVTRIDLALDYRGPVPILRNMFNASRPDVWRESIKSPLRFKAPLPVGWDESTIYYGALAKGTSCIVAYNKALEQEVAGPWTRIEFRTRDRDLCGAIQTEIIEGRPMGELTAAMLLKYLKFITPGTGSKYNRPVVAWWSQLLKEGAGFKFVRHEGGKDESGPRPSPNPCTVTKYLLDALGYENRKEVLTAIKSLVEQIECEERIADEWTPSNHVGPALVPLSLVSHL